VWEASVVSGEPSPADDVSELRWFALDELPPPEECAFRWVAPFLSGLFLVPPGPKKANAPRFSARRQTIKGRRAGFPGPSVGEGEGEASNKSSCKEPSYRIRLRAEGPESCYAARPSERSSEAFGCAPTAAAAGAPSLAQRCRERVARFAEVITEQSKRLGMWMDWDADYYTFTDTNIEYIWRFLQEVHRCGWLYKGHRSTVPRCGRPRALRPRSSSPGGPSPRSPTGRCLRKSRT